MGGVTDPTAEAIENNGGTADRETGWMDGVEEHGEQGRVFAEREKPSESNAVDVGASEGVGGGGAVVVEGQAGNGEGKPAIEFSPAPARIHRGASGGIFRGASGGGMHRAGSAGGVGPHRGASGGIYRGRSGALHLPSLTSITFSMSRLPEDDAGVQMHLTQTEEVETPSSSTRVNGDDDGDDAPPKKKSRLRKRLTVVGACSCSFRLAETVLSLVAIVVMCSNSQSLGTLAGLDFGTLRFNHFQAYKYLVAVNVCVFLYSTLQFILLAYTVVLGISFIPSIVISTCLTFGFDQLFAYLLLSASTSAATVSNMSYTGEMGVRLCSRYDLGSFCARADAAVTMSFFTFLAMLSSTILAIYRIGILLKEY